MPHIYLKHLLHVEFHAKHSDAVLTFRRMPCKQSPVLIIVLISLCRCGKCIQLTVSVHVISSNEIDATCSHGQLQMLAHKSVILAAPYQRQSQSIELIALS